MKTTPEQRRYYAPMLAPLLFEQYNYYIQRGYSRSDAIDRVCDDNTSIELVDFYKWLCEDIENIRYLENAIKQIAPETKEGFCIEYALKEAQYTKCKDLLNSII